MDGATDSSNLLPQFPEERGNVSHTSYSQSSHRRVRKEKRVGRRGRWGGWGGWEEGGDGEDEKKGEMGRVGRRGRWEGCLSRSHHQLWAKFRDADYSSFLKPDLAHSRISRRAS